MQVKSVMLGVGSVRTPDTYLPQPRSFSLGRPRPATGRIPFDHRSAEEIDADADRRYEKYGYKKKGR